jgi:hypothetical protein
MDEEEFPVGRYIVDLVAMTCKVINELSKYD